MIAPVKRRHSFCLRTDYLENDGHRALLPVIITDRQRNPLPFIIHADDHKLPGQTIFCNPLCTHDHLKDRVIQLLLFKNFKHNIPHFRAFTALFFSFFMMKANIALFILSYRGFLHVVMLFQAAMQYRAAVLSFYMPHIPCRKSSVLSAKLLVRISKWVPYKGRL